MFRYVTKKSRPKSCNLTEFVPLCYKKCNLTERNLTGTLLYYKQAQFLAGISLIHGVRSTFSLVFRTELKILYEDGASLILTRS